METAGSRRRGQRGDAAAPPAPKRRGAWRVSPPAHGTCKPGAVGRGSAGSWGQCPPCSVPRGPRGRSGCSRVCLLHRGLSSEHPAVALSPGAPWVPASPGHGCCQLPEPALQRVLHPEARPCCHTQPTLCPARRDQGTRLLQARRDEGQVTSAGTARDRSCPEGQHASGGTCVWGGTRWGTAGIPRDRGCLEGQRVSWWALHIWGQRVP